MQKRQSVQKRGTEGSLPELLDRLELALAETPVRTSVWKALSDLNERLASVGKKAPARTSRSTPSRRRRQTAFESPKLFS
jgi:hypothetical protein